MDDLHWSLLFSGILIILLVLIYNDWKRAKVAECLFKSECEKNLSDTKYEEIKLASLQVKKEELNFSHRINNISSSLGVIDKRIDCVVSLKFFSPLPGEFLLNSVDNFKCIGNKLILIEGHPIGNKKDEMLSNKNYLDNAQGHSFFLLQSDENYDELLIAIQLVDRLGALKEIEFSKFILEVQNLAEALDVLPEIPDMVEVISRGNDLDTFAAQCDVQLLLNIVSDNNAWSAELVKDIATKANLRLTTDGKRFIKFDENNIPIFSMKFGEADFLSNNLINFHGKSITLFLDVPNVEESITPFCLVWNYASFLADKLNGRIVDTQYRDLNMEQFNSINLRLSSIYECLNKAGIPAGSPIARRLFSSTNGFCKENV